MRFAGNGWSQGGSALVVCALLSACSYDFDALIAQPGPAGTGGTAGSVGIAGSSGAGGSDAGGGTAGNGSGPGGASGATGTGGVGTGGTGGGAGGTTGTDAGMTDGGRAGSADAGKGGDAAPDRRVDAIGDMRTDGAFDCAAVAGTVYQGHCYYPSATSTSWDVANATSCASPSHLAVVTTQGEQMVVAAILPGVDRWIGLRKDAGPPNNEMAFHWVTGEQLSFKNWDVYDAGTPEPNFTGDCVRMRPTNAWGDTGCTETYAAVCERE
jgi:Lectin C-type domain